jgi:hypothetical protein
MTRSVVSSVAIAIALGAGLVAQDQQPPAASPVTIAGCVERWSAGATGSGTLGSAAGNPATTQGAFKLSKIEIKSGGLGDSKDREKPGAKDVRIMTKDDKIDLSKHVGHKVEVMGRWSNSEDTMGTGGSGTGQGGSGTGGTATGSNRGNAGAGGRAILNPANGELNPVLMVTDLKMVASSCDGK